MEQVTEQSILEYLKTLKFKRALFGISKSDALLKMKALNTMYRSLISSGKAENSSDRLYQEKVEAVAKAFVDIQKQADGIIAEAQKKADAILAEAKTKADGLVSVKREQFRQEEEKKLKELKKLEEQKAEVNRYLEMVRDSTQALLKRGTLPAGKDSNGTHI